MEKKRLLDQIGQRLLNELQHDARQSYADLGKKVGLSAPAVIERVRQMEEAGIITGYHAAMNLKEIGLPVTAFIRLTTPPERYPRVIELARKLPQILECHHVSGGDSFIMKVAVASLIDIEELVSQLGVFGTTVTTMVLSSPVHKYEVAGSFKTEDRPPE